MARCWATASGTMDCLGSDDVVRDLIIELCFLRGPCRAYMGSRGLFNGIFWTQITYQLFSTCWIILELGIFRTQLTNSQIGSGFKAYPLN
jgi:hypothetical protein